MPVALFGRSAAIAGGAARPDASVPLPVGAIVLVEETFDGLDPGQPVPGWTSGVRAQSSELAPGGGPGAALVTTNIPAAYYVFPLTRGVLTVEVWLKAPGGEKANCALRVGNHAGGWRGYDAVISRDRPVDGDAMTVASILMKSSDDLWRYYAHNPAPGSPLAYPIEWDDDCWRHVRVRYDTRANEYDLYVDGRAVARAVRSDTDLSAGVSFVSVSSGRWHRADDVASYMDDVRVYVERGAPMAGDALTMRR